MATRPGSGSSRPLSDQKRELITTAGDDALARVGGYLRGTTVLAGLIAITDYVFMLLLGVPLALPLAVLVFLGGYIPYFGGIVSDGHHPARHAGRAGHRPGPGHAAADGHPQRHPGLPSCGRWSTGGRSASIRPSC